MGRNGLFGLHCGEQSPCTIIGLAWPGARWTGAERGKREWVEVDNFILEW